MVVCVSLPPAFALAAFCYGSYFLLIWVSHRVRAVSVGLAGLSVKDKFNILFLRVYCCCCALKTLVFLLQFPKASWSSMLCMPVQHRTWVFNKYSWINYNILIVKFNRFKGHFYLVGFAFTAPSTDQVYRRQPQSQFSAGVSHSSWTPLHTQAVTTDTYLSPLTIFPFGRSNRPCGTDLPTIDPRVAQSSDLRGRDWLKT